ncbi:hypothetical protein KY084_16055 [Stakelama sp. CBK3Z-3]|uniref:ATP-binding protein n=1 Tax=Stakelama flava TaxID=2860338 RepID=A0ABS6XQ65_9SPHN|nr:hypothetical protein [Stakelama flava]MBW4332362.1 hypothetical protein [Stakelama flava]
MSAGDLSIPEDQRGRQAVVSLGGYVHQLVATMRAWQRLGAGEALLLEVAEDYAVLASDALQMTQVKRESSGTSLTLRRADARKAILSLWQFRAANPDHDVRLHFLTTAPIGKEASTAFPEGATGIGWWARAAQGADVEPLRAFLLTLKWPDGLAVFLATASADALRDGLLRRISWLTGADQTRTLLDTIGSELRERAVGQGLLASDGERALPLLALRVLETVLAEDRRLTGRDFEAAWEKATTLPIALSIARQMLAGSGGEGTQHNSGPWHAVTFGQSRGLGPALLARALGAADALQCPRLPEAADLERELDTGYSARLAGMPGAGKSVCALQAARGYADRGFRILRLTDPRCAAIPLSTDGVPTLHLIDDAHLASSAALTLAEQSCGPDSLLLSTFTSVDTGGTSSGMIHLDAKRAVRVIADDLRSRRTETMAEVSKVDDSIGDRPGEENIDWRIDAAAASDFPWQFCFVLSAGWRRVRSIVASAREVQADILLGAIAIRQIASRDARTARSDLDPYLDAAGIEVAAADKAIAWLVKQRLVLGDHDLRCPHQRFSAEVFDPILREQDERGRGRIAAMIGHALADPAMPLAGLGSLLSQFRTTRSGYNWTWLIGRERLEPFLARCWSATEPTDIAAAMHALREIDAYAKDYFKRPTRDQIATVARWFSAPAPGAAYAVGNFINGTYRNTRLGRAIVRASDPEATAAALNAAMASPSADFASEIVHMVYQSFGGLTPEWTERFLAGIDRKKAIAFAAAWPASSHLYRAAWFCAGLIYLDKEFGYDVTAAMAPAMAGPLRENPVEAFAQLEDIFWGGLKVYEPFGRSRGKRGATTCSLSIAAKICDAWEPKRLAEQLSGVTLREFERAGILLHVLRRCLPAAYQETVAALDWDRLDAAIGADWKAPSHDAVAFLCQCYESKLGRAAVAQLVEKHVDEIGQMGSRLAFIAPSASYRQIERGAPIALAGQWSIGAAVLADFHKHRRALVPALIGNHPRLMAEALSK